MATAVQNYSGTEHDADHTYKPGVLAGVEVSDQPNADLSQEEITALKTLCTKATQRDTPARLIEVIQAWEAALFYRGFQFLVPLRGGGWKIPGESTGYGPSMQMDLALLPTNIYSSYAQIVISSLTRSVPGVRFEPQDATKDNQVTAAQSAYSFLKVFERNNDLIVIQTDASRYLWTDGRFHYWTRFVRDGQRFGWEDQDEPDDIVPEDEPSEDQADAMVAAEEEKEIAPTEEPVEGEEEPGAEAKSAEEEDEELQDVLLDRVPRGQEVRTAHGKLEVKLVPMMANSIAECDVIQYETEVDSSRAKGMFPEKAKDIKGGGSGCAEGEIARLARQNVKLGMQSTYVTSDSVAEDVTIQRTWMRPSYLMHVTNESVRNSLIKKFPDGVLVVYAGEVFIHARNESPDWSWSLGQAYSGDGQNRNALGTSVMPVQKRLNNWLDLMNDYFVRGIPKIWMDNKTFNVDALRGQVSVPGDRGPFKRVPGVPVEELVWAEPKVEPPANLAEFVQQYSGPLAELLTGGYPALAGGQTDTDTFRGMALQRDQALGRLGPTWHSIQVAEAESGGQAVRWGAKCRKGTINERIPGGETIRLEVNDLKANILAFPESDENFPESYPQKQQRLMGLLEDSAKMPQLQEVFFNPANLEFMQRMTGLTDLYIPQVAAYKKQLGELELLAKSDPLPNPDVLKATLTIQKLKAAGVDPQLLLAAEQQLEAMPQEVCSIDIDPADDDATEAMTCWQFMNSEEGRKLKRNDPNKFANVSLHFTAHQDAAANKAAANAPKQPPKPPSVSVGYKDVADPNAQNQILEAAGIQPSPAPPPNATPAPPSAMPALPAVAAAGGAAALQ